MITKIGEVFYGKNPFAGFQDRLYSPYAIRELPVLAFKDAIDLLFPEKILFLGSPDAAYSGAEKLRAAKTGEILHLFDKKNDVNEWLLEHTDNFNGGSLHSYERFIQSLRIKQLANRITPVPLDFTSGVEILYRKRMRFDLIYIDETFHDPAILEQSKILLRILEAEGVIALSQKHDLCLTLSRNLTEQHGFDGESAHLKTVKLIGADLRAAFTAKRPALQQPATSAAAPPPPASVAPPPLTRPENAPSVTQTVLQKVAAKAAAKTAAAATPPAQLTPEEEVNALLKDVNLSDLPAAAAKLLQNPGVKKNPNMVRNILRNNPPRPKSPPPAQAPAMPSAPPKTPVPQPKMPNIEEIAAALPSKESVMKKLPPLPKAEPGQSQLAALLRSPDFKNNPAALREAVRRYSGKKDVS